MEKREGAIRLHMLLDEKLARAVDNYRYLHRLPSRTAAIEAMLRETIEQRARKPKEKELECGHGM